MFLKVQMNKPRWTAAAACCMCMSYSAPARQAETLAQLHDRLAGDNVVLSSDEARQAADLAAQWRLQADQLSPTELARLACVECYVAAAVGDANAALERARTLLEQYPSNRDARAASYVAAVAAGDAQLAYSLAKKLSKDAGDEQRRLASRRRRLLRGVGKPAPVVTLRTADKTSYSVCRRANRVLLIDFWNTNRARTEEIEALRALYREHRDSMHFEMAGVNSDADLAGARAFAKKNGFIWDQCYEGDASPTLQAFRTGDPPWLVLVDAYGNIRATGSASEPGFRYALRAAIAETSGDFKAVTPRTRTGKQPVIAQVEYTPTPKQNTTEQGAGAPSNPEALGKLRQARAFFKTGNRTKAKALFEEIVRDYPGTPEARDAQEYLDSAWPP